MDLHTFFSQHPAVAVAVSGGTDSAYLLYAASQAARVRAYCVHTPFQTPSELEDARRLCVQLGVELTVLDVDILENAAVQANPANRCYYCKRALFAAIGAAAQADGFDCVIEGTNASDDVSDRPGWQALQELGVRSPLRMAGLTKAEIRARSQAAGLFTHDKPANACLATRIPTGQPITRELLAKTAAAEAFLRTLGFCGLRVRHFHGCARIQIPEAQMPLLLEHRVEILQHFQDDYAGVLLDLEVRHV